MLRRPIWIARSSVENPQSVKSNPQSAEADNVLGMHSDCDGAVYRLEAVIEVRDFIRRYVERFADTSSHRVRF
jgi:hypothetical protein